MFKNVTIKRILKSTIFKGIFLINKFIYKDDKKILLYSSNKGLWSNVKVLKDFLVNNAFYDKYSIYAGIENLRYAEDDKEKIKYVGKIKSFVTFMNSKYVFYTSGQIPIKPNKSQVVVYLGHGSAFIKKSASMSNINNGDDFYSTHYLIPSELYRDIIKKTFLCKDKNILICGEQVTDAFFEPHTAYDFGTYDKLILWAPTFRQSDYCGYDDSSETLIPMYDDYKYDELNERLKQYNFKLIVKLHPVQNVGIDLNREYSNIVIFDDFSFKEKGYDLYKLMVQSDYFIGDYSSAYLQYLLLDKPLAFVIPDIEEYSRRRGFIFDNITEYMPGDLIYNKKDLYSTLERWHKNLDDYKTKRVEVTNKIYKYRDGKNTERILSLCGICK